MEDRISISGRGLACLLPASGPKRHLLIIPLVTNNYYLLKELRGREVGSVERDCLPQEYNVADWSERIGGLIDDTGTATH